MFTSLSMSLNNHSVYRNRLLVKCTTSYYGVETLLPPVSWD